VAAEEEASSEAAEEAAGAIRFKAVEEVVEGCPTSNFSMQEKEIAYFNGK